MNKIFKTMMLAAATVLGIASCENVPAPFIEPGQSDTEEVIDAKGSGTLADPFNVAGVINYVKELGADVESPGQVYIKGIVCSTEDISPQYKNATFKISDDVNSVKDAFTVYRAKGLKNQDIKSEDEVQVGDTIIVCGNVVNYKGNTPETVQNKAHIHWQKRGNKVLDGSATDTPDTPTDGGTWDKPYTVAQAIADQSGKEVWVRGYIVGSIPADASSTVMENMTFTADGANHTNLCIADSPEETNYANCAPVQLPSGSDARTNLNLKENPTMLGKEVWLKGKTMKYCGANGLKEISKYTLTAPTANDDEETGNTPAEGAKGDGSLENPFNAAGAHNYVTALPADEVTAEKFYIKGIVCESSKMDISTQYKNATFHISDDGTTNGTHFLIFRTKGLNGADITSEDDVKVGDEVVVYAKLVNYKGNTPETSQGGIIVSINGQTGGSETPDEGEEDNPDVPTEGNILQNGDFEFWEGGLPTNWKSASTASNAELTQSTEAHGGTYAVSIGFVTSANKRMAYKETTLPAGTYKFSFYAKGTDTTEGSKCQARPGYVPMKADGSANSSSYKYGAHANLSATEWTYVEHEFTLEEETNLCLVIMSPKGSEYHTSQNILVDDATLIKVN